MPSRDNLLPPRIPIFEAHRNNVICPKVWLQEHLHDFLLISELKHFSRHSKLKPIIPHSNRSSKNYEINKREIWLFVSSVSVQCVAPITRLGSTNLEDRENKEWARERPIFSAKSHREKFDMWLHKHENKFYSVFEPFQISQFFVRNPNLSASRFCSKLNFSAILVHFENALKFCFRTYSECTKIGSCDWSFEKEIARCDMAQKRTKILFSCICHHIKNLLWWLLH